MSAKRMMVKDKANKEPFKLQQETGLMPPNLFRIKGHVDPAMPLQQIHLLKEHITFTQKNGQKQSFSPNNFQYHVLLNSRINTILKVVMEDGTQIS